MKNYNKINVVTRRGKYGVTMKVSVDGCMIAQHDVSSYTPKQRQQLASFASNMAYSMVEQTKNNY